MREISQRPVCRAGPGTLGSDKGQDALRQDVGDAARAISCLPAKEVDAQRDECCNEECRRLARALMLRAEGSSETERTAGARSGGCKGRACACVASGACAGTCVLKRVCLWL